jgi:hypothetical protein
VVTGFGYPTRSVRRASGFVQTPICLPASYTQGDVSLRTAMLESRCSLRAITHNCGELAFSLTIILFAVGCTTRHSTTLDRRVRQFSWPSRYESCDTLWILSNLHRAADVSMGIERLADSCWKKDDAVDQLWWRRGTTTQISNENVRQILNRVTAADPAYEWRELAGVVVVRPRVSWDRPHPILTPSVERFETQSSNFGPAFDAVNRAFGPRRGFWCNRPQPV